MTAAGAVEGPVEGRVLALDIGGTKLAAGVVAQDGTVLSAARRPTPSDDAEALWRAVLDLAADVTAGEGVAAVGVGCGGPMRWPVGEVSPLNIPAWRDFPLRLRLADHFGVPVRLHNDAVCLAVAEHWRGAARGHDHALGMVVSTGVGGGLILAGRLLDGATGNGGHVGHVVVDPAGPACSCGGRGCLEAVASGPRIADWARTQGWSGPSARELAEDARAGAAIARQAFERAGWALGVAVASVAAVADLDVAVLGGGVMAADDLVLPSMRAALDVHAALPFTRRLRVERPALGADVGLVGAAALVLGGDRYWSADLPE